MSSSLLLQQCPACLVCLIWIVFVMGGRWLYKCCFVGVASKTCSIFIFTNPSARAGYDTRSSFLNGV